MFALDDDDMEDTSEDNFNFDRFFDDESSDESSEESRSSNHNSVDSEADPEDTEPNEEPFNSDSEKDGGEDDFDISEEPEDFNSKQSKELDDESDATCDSQTSTPSEESDTAEEKAYNDGSPSIEISDGFYFVHQGTVLYAIIDNNNGSWTVDTDTVTVARRRKVLVKGSNNSTKLINTSNTANLIFNPVVIVSGKDYYVVNKTDLYGADGNPIFSKGGSESQTDTAVNPNPSKVNHSRVKPSMYSSLDKSLQAPMNHDDIIIIKDNINNIINALSALRDHIK